ncbi:hypothetical protein HMPREF0620_0020 [Parascardovia denticolens DSM 10105 = JCM 12538]|uniref:Uncharacterized protein n=1 Tax=Parascardovia denticolens DSM 10105 = JCM 12538 TaxID=864564 RepID=E6JYF6_PARDN|nr:hypothetical protein HMPREF0620_0020 [Parascardovia denticolens DSM 10105 = JCM 12538]
MGKDLTYPHIHNDFVDKLHRCHLPAIVKKSSLHRPAFELEMDG